MHLSPYCQADISGFPLTVTNFFHSLKFDDVSIAIFSGGCFGSSANCYRVFPLVDA